eukprot:m.101481 g.101481  ORF g.101481 m.101481 type:complete len:104 (-) comp27332_c0_seq2:172-483(-)
MEDPQDYKTGFVCEGAALERVNGKYAFKGFWNHKPVYKKVGDENVELSYFRAAFPWCFNLCDTAQIGVYGAWTDSVKDTNPPVTGWCQYGSDATTSIKLTFDN